MPASSDFKYTIRDYETACQASNHAFATARVAGFADLALQSLGNAIRHEKEVRAHLETDGMRKEAEAVRQRYAPLPVKMVGKAVAAESGVLGL